jgi:hypothetical protein
MMPRVHVDRAPRATRGRTAPLLVLLLALLLVLDATPGAGQATASRPPATPVPAGGAVDTAAWLADLAQLRHALTRQYPNLEWAVERRGIALGELSRNTEAALRAAPSDAAARSIVEAFLNAFGDGHLEVRWPSPSGATPAGAPAAAAREPARPAGVCERLGYRRARRGGGIRFDLLPGFRWLASPDSAYFRAGVMVAGDDRLGVLRIASFEDDIHPELCETAARALGIAADAACDETCADRVARETANQLTAALERRIAELQAAGITRLLVDVTSNGGGTNWVEAAARTLTPVALRGARQGFIRHPHYVRAFDADIARLVRDSAASRGEVRVRIGRALEVLRRQRREASLACDRSGMWEGRAPGCSLVVSDPPRYSTGALAYAPPESVDTTAAWRALYHPARYRHREGVYRGPLMVLVDRGTVSAAEYFAALMMDNSAGVVAGAPTFGAGCGYTNGGIPTVLPHSRGRVLIPDCVRYRASGSNEVEGVAPDLPIPWRPNDTPLQRARRVLETLVSAQ